MRIVRNSLVCAKDAHSRQNILKHALDFLIEILLIIKERPAL